MAEAVLLENVSSATIIGAGTYTDKSVKFVANTDKSSTQTGTSIISGEKNVQFKKGCKLNADGTLEVTIDEAVKLTADSTWSIKCLMGSGTANQTLALNTQIEGVEISGTNESTSSPSCIEIKNIPSSTKSVTIVRGGNKEVWIYEIVVTYYTGTAVDYPVTKITNNGDQSIKLGVNSKYTFNYTIEPSNYTDSLTWESENEQVAKVEDGVVTAVSDGTANITVTADSGASYTWEVFVPKVDAASIELDVNEYEGFIGETFQLTETITPSDASNVITWSAEPTSVAIVDGNGLVTLVGEGEAVITVSTDNGLSDTCAVTVSKVKTTSVEFAAESMNVGVWDTFEVSATVLPENTQDTITYRSSDDTVATVVDGVVTTLKEGEVTITCESGEYSDEITLVVGAGSLNFTKGTDEAYAVDASTYYINGFRMSYNKTHSRGAQCGDIEFTVKNAGTITFKYFETGGDKGRMAKLTDASGNVVAEGAANTSSGSTLLTLEAFLNPGTYLFTNYESAGAGASTLVNLESISFVESDAQLYYQYDDEAQPTAVRFIGSIEVENYETIDSITLHFVKEGVAASKDITITTLYTAVANTRFDSAANTYYVVYVLNGVQSVLNQELEVTMTVTFNDGNDPLIAARSFTLGK